jgi:membrane-associated protein
VHPDREDGPTVVDVLTGFGALLHSAWLLPLLLVMIAADGPFPVLPSETILMSASALAFGGHDWAAVAALFAVSVVGSMIGDLLVFGLGRSSRRIVALTDVQTGISGWVRRHLLARPGVALIGARLVPGGRLVSTAAAGRFGLPVRRFLPWTLASSAVWGCYMLLVGLALGPVTGGEPLLCLAAGVVMAVLTAGAFAVGQRVRARLAARRAPVVAAVAEPEAGSGSGSEAGVDLARAA